MGARKVSELSTERLLEYWEEFVIEFKRRGVSEPFAAIKVEAVKDFVARLDHVAGVPLKSTPKEYVHEVAKVFIKVLEGGL